MTEEERDNKDEWENNLMSEVSTRKQILKVLDESFKLADLNGNGRLNRAEFELYLRRIGECALELNLPWRARTDQAWFDLNYQAFNGYN